LVAKVGPETRFDHQALQVEKQVFTDDPLHIVALE
jgi:hypothetical protein